LDFPQYAVISKPKMGSLGQGEQPSFRTSDDSDICNPDLSPQLEVRNDLETARHVTVGLAPLVKLFKIEHI
jgi:hypothetical protein